jgi:hypothetical protein
LILKFEVDLKITISLLFTLKNLMMIIYVFKKHENFLKTMKIVEFFLIIREKLSELEPEPEFLTSWSRSWSRTKMDRLRNTGLEDKIRIRIKFADPPTTAEEAGTVSTRAHDIKHKFSINQSNRIPVVKIKKKKLNNTYN